MLQVLDKRGSESFSLRDMELLAVFAAQATAAISATAVQRGAARLMTHILQHVGDGTLTPDQVDVIVSRTQRASWTIMRDTPFWHLVDHVERRCVPWASAT